jgi:hypothetical protein
VVPAAHGIGGKAQNAANKKDKTRFIRLLKKSPALWQ